MWGQLIWHAGHPVAVILYSHSLASGVDVSLRLLQALLSTDAGSPELVYVAS